MNLVWVIVLTGLFIALLHTNPLLVAVAVVAIVLAGVVDSKTQTR